MRNRLLSAGRGGAAETVVGQGSDATGVLFPWPEAESLAWAVDRFEARLARGAYGRAHLQQRAKSFDRRHFIKHFEEVLRDLGADLAPATHPQASASFA